MPPAQMLELFPSAGQDLVGIGLMTYVENYLVLGGIEHIMQSHNEFHGAQAGGQVPGVAGAAFNYIIAEFSAQFCQLFPVGTSQVGGRIDLVQQFVHSRHKISKFSRKNSIFGTIKNIIDYAIVE